MSVGTDVVEIIANYGSEVVPVIYMSSHERTGYNLDSFSFLDNMTDYELESIEGTLLKMIISQITYFPHTNILLKKIVNIILGAVYSESSEIVKYVDDSTVITDKYFRVSTRN